MSRCQGCVRAASRWPPHRSTTWCVSATGAVLRGKEPDHLDPRAQQLPATTAKQPWAASSRSENCSTRACRRRTSPATVTRSPTTWPSSKSARSEPPRAVISPVFETGGVKRATVWCRSARSPFSVRQQRRRTGSPHGQIPAEDLRWHADPDRRRGTLLPICVLTSPPPPNTASICSTRSSNWHPADRGYPRSTDLMSYLRMRRAGPDSHRNESNLSHRRGRSLLQVRPRERVVPRKKFHSFPIRTTPRTPKPLSAELLLADRALG